MTFSIPPLIARLVLSRALEEEVNVNTASSQTTPSRALESSSWALVCREWAIMVHTYRWANRSFDVAKKVDEKDLVDKVGAICQSFLAAIELRSLTSDWMEGSLACLASRLISLRLNFVERPTAAALLALQKCANLERLDVVCTEEQRGNLHDILDILRFFTNLEQVSLTAFDAPPPPPPLRRPPSARKKRSAQSAAAMYTFPSTLTHLMLYDLGGRDLEKYLLNAFNPSYLHSLASLTLSGFSNATSQALISALGSNLYHLIYQIDCRNSPPSSPLPENQPFPSLSFLVLELVGTTPRTFYRTCADLYTPDRHLPCPKELHIIDPATDWSADEIRSVVTSLQRLFPPTGAQRCQDSDWQSREFAERYKGFLASIVHNDKVPEADKITLGGLLYLAWSFRKNPRDLVLSEGLFRGTAPLSAKDVLERSAALRWKKEEEKKVDKAELGAGQGGAEEEES